MNKLEILKAGMMTSIQDLGRKGMAYYAVPQSGVMDQNAAKIALLLLNKKENSPLIECTCIAPKIKFHAPTAIVLTGADFNWQLNRIAVPLNTILNIKKDDILKGTFAKDGLRGYIAINEELDIEKIYNSYSTYTNAKIGGFEGRLLQKGDIITWKNAELQNTEQTIIPIRKGPEFHYLTALTKYQLTSNIYTIKTDSNRMGVRIAGTPLTDSLTPLKYSVPILPGFIQLPPNGLPIVVLQDGQTTGGYPRIAYIQTHYLSIFNQIPLGKAFKFEWH